MNCISCDSGKCLLATLADIKLFPVDKDFRCLATDKDDCKEYEDENKLDFDAEENGVFEEDIPGEEVLND